MPSVQHPSDSTAAELYADVGANILRQDKKRNKNTYMQLSLPGTKLLNTFKRPGRLISPKLLPSSMMQRIITESSWFFSFDGNSLRRWSFLCGANRELLKLTNLKKMFSQTSHSTVLPAQNCHTDIILCLVFLIFLHKLPHTRMANARLLWVVRNRIFLIFRMICGSLLR